MRYFSRNMIAAPRPRLWRQGAVGLDF